MPISKHTPHITPVLTFPHHLPCLHVDLPRRVTPVPVLTTTTRRWPYGSSSAPPGHHVGHEQRLQQAERPGLRDGLAPFTRHSHPTHTAIHTPLTPHSHAHAYLIHTPFTPHSRPTRASFTPHSQLIHNSFTPHSHLGDGLTPVVVRQHVGEGARRHEEREQVDGPSDHQPPVHSG